MAQTTQRCWKVDTEPDWRVTRVRTRGPGSTYVRVDDGWRLVRWSDRLETEELGALLTWRRLLAAHAEVQDESGESDETWWTLRDGEILDVCPTAMEARLRASFAATPTRPMQVYAGHTWQVRTLRSVVTGTVRP